MTTRASNNIPSSLLKVWQQQEEFGRASTSKMAEGRAIVSHDTFENGGWKMEDIFVRKPGKGELLIDMVASGVCHTDALIGGIPDGAAPIAFYPRVLGHEGAGYVREVGEGVHVAQPGDPVRIATDTKSLSHLNYICLFPKPKSPRHLSLSLRHLHDLNAANLSMLWRAGPTVFRLLRQLRDLQVWISL